MTTATRVPVTHDMSGQELGADDAWTTVLHYGWWPLAKEAFTRFRYADGFSHSRALGLQYCLALIPLAIAIVGLSVSMNQARIGQVLTAALRELSPGGTQDFVEQALAQGAAQAATGQLALWFGLLAALVALTTAMGQVERGANRIYGIERDRPSKEKYGRAAMLAVTAGILSLLGFIVLVAGGAIGTAFGWGEGATMVWNVLRWPLGLMLALGSYTVIFERAPRRNQPGLSWLAVGASVSLALWLIFTLLLSLYVASSSSFGSTYGPLTGVFALLIWAYLTSIALFLGIAVAAQLEAIRGGQRQPAEPDPEPVVAHSHRAR
jgi:YihY family inner membrane protein